MSFYSIIYYTLVRLLHFAFINNAYNKWKSLHVCIHDTVRLVYATLSRSVAAMWGEGTVAGGYTKCASSASLKCPLMSRYFSFAPILCFTFSHDTKTDKEQMYSQQQQQRTQKRDLVVVVPDCK
jgi:hypothetical protein